MAEQIINWAAASHLLKNQSAQNTLLTANEALYVIEHLREKESDSEHVLNQNVLEKFKTLNVKPQDVANNIKQLLNLFTIISLYAQDSLYVKKEMGFDLFDESHMNNLNIDLYDRSGKFLGKLGELTKSNISNCIDSVKNYFEKQYFFNELLNSLDKLTRDRYEH